MSNDRLQNELELNQAIHRAVAEGMQGQKDLREEFYRVFAKDDLVAGLNEAVSRDRLLAEKLLSGAFLSLKASFHIEEVLAEQKRRHQGTEDRFSSWKQL